MISLVGVRQYFLGSGGGGTGSGSHQIVGVHRRPCPALGLSFPTCTGSCLTQNVRGPFCSAVPLFNQCSG